MGADHRRRMTGFRRRHQRSTYNEKPAKSNRNEAIRRSSQRLSRVPETRQTKWSATFDTFSDVNLFESIVLMIVHDGLSPSFRSLRASAAVMRTLLNLVYRSHSWHAAMTAVWAHCIHVVVNALRTSTWEPNIVVNVGRAQTSTWEQQGCYWDRVKEALLLQMPLPMLALESEEGKAAAHDLWIDEENSRCEKLLCSLKAVRMKGA